MREGLRSGVREDDPLRAQLPGVRTQRRVREVERDGLVEREAFADEQVRTIREARQSGTPLGIARVRDDAPTDRHAQAVWRGRLEMRDGESEHLERPDARLTLAQLGLVDVEPLSRRR